MVSKCNVVLETPKMKSVLTLRTPKLTKGVLIDSEEYVAIGCDLRNIKRLDRLIRNVVLVEECTVLCIAEVSIAYMEPDDADAVIAWTSTLSSGEQV
jgi:tRNA wybutosine-synthesizing protein 4